MLSDIIEPRLVELGKIKIGRKSDRVLKSKSGHAWSPPEKIDHFLLTTLGRDEHGQLLLDTALMNQLTSDKYADPDGKIRHLPIRLLSNDPEDVLQSAWCWYASKSIGARSNGKTVTWFIGHTVSDWCKVLPDPIEEPWKPGYADLVDGKGNRLFKKHTVLNCVIASAGSRFGGVHKFRTTSAITASQLYGGLLHILQLTGGVLIGMPLQLVVRPLPVNPLVNGTPQGATVYVVHIEMVGSDLQALQAQALKQIEFSLATRGETAIAVAQYRKILQAPGYEKTDAEVKEISEEFHPESQDEEPAEVQMPRAINEPIQTPTVESPKIQIARDFFATAMNDAAINHGIKRINETFTGLEKAELLKLAEDAKQRINQKVAWEKDCAEIQVVQYAGSLDDWEAKIAQKAKQGMISEAQKSVAFGLIAAQYKELTSLKKDKSIESEGDDSSDDAPND